MGERLILRKVVSFIPLPPFLCHPFPISGSTWRLQMSDACSGVGRVFPPRRAQGLVFRQAQAMSEVERELIETAPALVLGFHLVKLVNRDGIDRGLHRL